MYDTRVVDWSLYCHNSACDLKGVSQVRSGILDCEIAWGEPDDPMCKCGRELATWVIAESATGN